MKKILSFLIAAMMCLSFTGCSSEGPEVALTSYLESIKNFDETQMKETGVYNSIRRQAGASSSLISDEQVTTLFKDLLSGFNYEIGEAKVDGDSATVKVTITNNDMTNVLTDYMNSVVAYAKKPSTAGISRSKLNAKVVTMLLDEIAKAKNAGKTKTFNVNVRMRKVDKQWQVTESTDLVDTMTGGFLTSAQNMQRNLKNFK